MRKTFLDIVFDDEPKEHILKKINAWLSSPVPAPHIIVTPGPEFAVRGWREPLFKALIREADLSVCDGVGVQIISFFGTARIKHRYPGVDLMYDTIQIAHRLRKCVALIGGQEESAQKTAAYFKKIFPGLAIDIVPTPHIAERKNQMRLRYPGALAEETVVATIHAQKPDIIFVALGAGKQEKWMFNTMPHLPTVRIAAGVGGAFDIFSGAAPRAPFFLRVLKCEWLWRFIKQPRRWKRTVTATVHFTLLTIAVQIAKIKPVRNNALAVIVHNGKFLLINNRLIENAYREEHWQFVQGGIEPGETPEQGLMRELEEETGTTRFDIIRKSGIYYQYPHPLSSPFSKKTFKIFYVRFTGEDADLKETPETSGYCWVDPPQLLDQLHPLRRDIGRKILNELKEPAFYDILK